MGRFFVPTDGFCGNTVRLSGEDAYHFSRVLRGEVGDRITVSDMRGGVYECVISNSSPELVIAEIIEKSVTDTEPPYRARLYQGMPKSDKLEYIIQKAVELGVSGVTPFLSERSVSRPDAAAFAKKRERWAKISEAAAKQSGRGIIPDIGKELSFNEMIKEASESALPIFCYEGDGTQPLCDILRSAKSDAGFLQSAPEIAIIIGPEGGFSESETVTAKNLGCKMAGLGKRILRTETASGCVLSCLTYEFDM